MMFSKKIMACSNFSMPFFFAGLLSSSHEGLASLILLYNRYQGRLTFQDTKFIRPVSDEEEDELFIDQVRRLFKEKKWKLEPYHLDMQNWPRLMALISECPALYLYAETMGRSTIMKELAHISFPNLLELNLSKNRLMTTESLQRLKSPKLKRLNLSSNLITRISSLRKSNFPQLISLSLRKSSSKVECNPINDHWVLSQMVMKSSLINLKLQEYLDERVVNQNLSWMAKMPPSSIMVFEISSAFRANQTVLLQKITQKYNQLEIEMSILINDQN